MSETNLPNDPNADPTAKKNGEGSDGDGQETKPPVDNGNNEPASIDQIPEELRHTVNAMMAQARKQGENKGKKKAEDEAKAKEDQAKIDKMKESDDYKSLVPELETRATTAESKLAEAERKLLALTVAVEKGLPNPVLMAKRLVGDTKEEMETDAEALKAIVGSKAPDDKKKEESQPPIAPKGGSNPKDGEDGKKADDDSFEAQMRNPAYYV